jgi:predicted CoA-binding protein
MEVSEGARRISEIVRSMKSYTYLDQAPVQDVDVHEGLESTLVIMRSKLKTGVEVRREYASGLPRITAYGSELNQVWTNIIDNALDAMAGRGTLTLRTRAEDGRIVVELEDDGPGIPPEIQGRVFDPFFTTKAPGKGTGLGLEISYRIVVDRHRGDIKVFSRPGRTTFRVTLPVTQDAGSAVPIAGGPRASDEDMKRLLQDARTIAVVGISTDPSKPAHEVPAYLATQGYDIIPINPKVDSVLERKAYADLASAPPGIDVVQVFRRPEAVPAVVGEAIAAGAKGVWMQPGVVNEEAAETARRAGLKVVMDACMMAEHRRLIGERK